MKRRVELARVVNKNISMRRRCLLLSLTRSTAYYQPANHDVDAVDHMNEIRDLYERHLFKGYKRITDDLHERGYVINHKRVYRLMKAVGLQAIYPKKNLSKRRQEDLVYPYLLKNRPPNEVHDCWCVDIPILKLIKNLFI